MAAIPILPWRVNNATHALPQILRYPEFNGLTVNAGTPVWLVNGYLQERPAFVMTSFILAGFTTEAGHNLAVPGTAPPVGGAGLFFGNVPNQVNARNVPLGAPSTDGNLGINVAADDTIFVGSTAATYTIAQTDLDMAYGLTKDTNGNWFIDTTFVRPCQIVGLVDPPGTLGGRLAFRVMRPAQQLFA